MLPTLLYNASTGCAIKNASTGVAIGTFNASGCACCGPPSNVSNGCWVGCGQINASNGSTYTITSASVTGAIPVTDVHGTTYSVTGQSPTTLAIGPSTSECQFNNTPSRVSGSGISETDGNLEVVVYYDTVSCTMTAFSTFFTTLGQPISAPSCFRIVSSNGISSTVAVPLFITPAKTVSVTICGITLTLNLT